MTTHADRTSADEASPATPASPQPTTTMTLAKAINAGLADALAADDHVLLAGEDIGRLGGVFRVTDGLQERFGTRRVIDTPLAESGIVGTAIGLAMRGYRSVLEIQFDGFVFPAFNQIVTQLAHIRTRSMGRTPMPIVIRIPYGGAIGAIEHHSESVEAYFCHRPGLKVVTCASASDGYWMMRQAIESDDPVIFLEPKRRYYAKGEVDRTSSSLGLHQSRVVRPGTDATIITYGPMVQTCLDAADAAQLEGRSLEVIDLRSLSPLDLSEPFASIRRTGRAVVVHEAPGNLGVGAEVIARIQQECFYSLEAPVQRVTGYDTPYPPARVEHEYLPSVDRILDAVDQAWSA